MSDTLYQRAMDGITASDAFKASLVAAMQQAAQETPAAGASAPASPAKKRTSKPLFFRVGATVAACAVVTVAAVLLAGRGAGGAAPAPTAMDYAAAPAEEPTAEASAGAEDGMAEEAMDAGGALSLLPAPALSDGGMGFEGYMAYSADELVSGNPWTADAALATLPVYENAALRGMDGAFYGGLSQPEMEAEARRTAEALGLEVQSMTAVPTPAEQKAVQEKGGADTGITHVRAETRAGAIDVERDGTVTIWLEPAVALPAGYSFTHHDTTYAEVQNTLDYLAGQYAALADMDTPTPDIGNGDYTCDGQQGYSFNLYEGSGDLTNQILGFHFDRVTFYPDDDGKLFIIRLFRTDLSRKLGDYPIITEGEARQLLAEGHYLTSVPEAMPGAQYIAKAELVYRTGALTEVFMPYYRFYVEVPDLAQPNGLKTYGAYYVPAVAGEYLEALPMWDGSFN